MQIHLLAPTLEEVERITRIDDPVIRNLQITQCYYDLSAVLASRTGLAANWCTYATWASKQAGQTIRKEDLSRSLERRLIHSVTAVQASENVSAAINVQGGKQFATPYNLALRARNFTLAVDRGQRCGRPGQ